MKVVCQDARTFRLEDHEKSAGRPIDVVRRSSINYPTNDLPSVGGADLITLSYSLSMIVNTPSRVSVELC